MIRRLCFSALALCFSGAAATAAPAETQMRRLCKPEDLKGVYLEVDFKEIPEEAEARMHGESPYQYLAFYPENTYAMLASNMEIGDAAQLNGLLGALAHSNYPPRYSMQGDGVLNLYSGARLLYSFRCVISLLDVPGYKKGDLILSAYTAHQETQLLELYRRWY